MAGFDELMSDEELQTYSQQQELRNKQLRQEEARASRRSEEESANKDLSLTGLTGQLAGLATPLTAPFRLAYDLSKGQAEGVPLAPFFRDLPGNTLEAAGGAVSEALQHPLRTAAGALPLAGEVAGAIAGSTVGMPALGAIGGRLLGEAGKSIINWEKPNYNEVVSNAMLAPLGASATVASAGKLKAVYKEEAGMNLAREMYGVEPEALGVRAKIGKILPEGREGIASNIIQERQVSGQADKEAQMLLDASKLMADERRDAWVEGLGQKVLKGSQKPLSASADIEAAYGREAGTEDAISAANMNTRMGLLSADSELADYFNAATPQPGGMRQMALKDYAATPEEKLAARQQKYNEQDASALARTQGRKDARLERAQSYIENLIDENKQSQLSLFGDNTPKEQHLPGWANRALDEEDQAVQMPGGMKQLPLSAVAGEETRKPPRELKWDYGDIQKNPELEKLLATDIEGAGVPEKMRQQSFQRTTVKGRPAWKVTDTEEQLAKKQGKADTAAHALGNELAMGPRLEEGWNRLMADPDFKAISEDLPEFLKPMAGNENYKLLPGTKDFAEVPPPSWWDRVRRLNFHSDREDNAFIQDLQKGATVKGIWNPQRILRQAQDPWAVAAAEHGNDSESLIHMLDHYFQKKAARVYKLHGVTNDDHDMQMILSRTPRLMEIYRENPKLTGEQILKQFTDETGQRVMVSGETDYSRMTRSMQARADLQSQIIDPMAALSKRMHPDPDYIRPQVDYFLPTYSHNWKSQELASQLESLKGHYAGLSPEMAAGDVGGRIQMQIQALNTKLTAAQQFGTEQEAAMRKAFQLYDDRGIIPKLINNPAFKNKYTDMTFGMDLADSMQDYIHSFIRKNVMDLTLPRLAEAAKNAANPRMQEYISRYAQDLLGRRRLAGIKATVTQLQGIPKLGEHVTEDMVRKTIDGISSWNAMWNIGFNPKFYPMQMAQNLINLFPLIRHSEAKAHGMKRAVFDFQQAYEEAAQAGAVQSGLGAIWEDVRSAGDPNSKLMNWAQAANKIPGASEAFNRVLGYHAALKDAELAGLSGREARQHAVATTTMANFGYSAAHRPQFSGSFMGSLMMRYRSYGLQYKNYLAHLIEHDPRAAAESFVTAIAIAGTGGIPLFGVLKKLGGLAGVSIPDMHPFQDLTGLDMGTSASPLEIGLPTDPASLAGPILGPGVNFYQGAMEGGEGGLQKLIGGVKGEMGVVPKNMMEGVAELARGGVTKTPAGHVQLQRSTGDILKHMANFAPSAHGEISQANRDINAAVDSGDQTAIEAAIAQHEKKGFVGGQSTYRRARGKERAEEAGKYRGALDMLLGR